MCLFPFFQKILILFNLKNAFFFLYFFVPIHRNLWGLGLGGQVRVFR